MSTVRTLNPFDLLADDHEPVVAQPEQKAPKKTVVAAKNVPVPLISRKPHVETALFVDAPMHKTTLEKEHRKPKTDRKPTKSTREARGVAERGSDKKDHGKGGWGTEGENVAESTENVANAENVLQSLHQVVAENAEEEVAAEPEIEYKSLQQFLAAKTPLAALSAARKPNEGVDESQWKDATLINKSPEDNFYVGAKENKVNTKVSHYKKDRKITKPTTKQTVDVDFRFPQPERSNNDRDRNDRGDRSSQRGGREGGSSRGKTSGNSTRAPRPSKAQAAINVDDQNLFPSLVGAQ